MLVVFKDDMRIVLIIGLIILLDKTIASSYSVHWDKSGALRQGCSQPPVALSCSSASPFTGALIVAWTDRRPRCQVMAVGKRPFRTHVHSRFCQDAGGGIRLDSWYGPVTAGQFAAFLSIGAIWMRSSKEIKNCRSKQVSFDRCN